MNENRTTGGIADPKVLFRWYVKDLFASIEFAEGLLVKHTNDPLTIMVSSITEKKKHILSLVQSYLLTNDGDLEDSLDWFLAFRLGYLRLQHKLAADRRLFLLHYVVKSEKSRVIRLRALEMEGLDEETKEIVGKINDEESEIEQIADDIEKSIG